MTLTVPARGEWALALRMAACGVCAVCDVPVDVMEDLGVAIEESADLLLHQGYAAETLTLECEPGDKGLRVTLSAQGRAPQTEEHAADPEVARLIIQTLVRDVDLERDGDGVRSVRMVLGC